MSRFAEAIGHYSNRQDSAENGNNPQKRVETMKHWRDQHSSSMRGHHLLQDLLIIFPVQNPICNFLLELWAASALFVSTFRKNIPTSAITFHFVGEPLNSRRIHIRHHMG